ncbi:MAG: glycosyltransferase [Arcobacter sp.]|nr:glycosyltransferase [Arcobacter sp.]
MLSILVPTYNYNIYPLAQELEFQALKANIVFEIVCIDDGSFSILNEENQKINTLTNCLFLENKKNIGRSKIRNLLAEKAKYDWLLFLDADVVPKNKDFVSTYINSITQQSEIIYGGILYQEKKPKPEDMLRWVYGKKREALNVVQRNKKKYLRFLTLSFLIKKSVFDTVRFNEAIPNNRHEDTLFAYDLKKAEKHLTHIDNPVYHLGLDTSKEFLEKSLLSIDSLLLLIKKGLISSKHTLITNVFSISKIFLLNNLFAFMHKTFKVKFERNLLSEKPSLFVFDLSRLCYLCFIDKKK